MRASGSDLHNVGPQNGTGVRAAVGATLGQGLGKGHHNIGGGKQRQGYGTACRQPDGSWKII